MTLISSQIFRQYDIRGVAEKDLSNETVELLGKAFGTYVKESGSRKVLVGRDNRLSSDRLRNAIIRGLLSAGCDVADIGLVVTPMLYYSRVHFGIDGGVMITGSHNPPDENGFKLALGNGTIYGDEIQKLKDIMISGNFTSGSAGRTGRGTLLSGYAQRQNPARPAKVKSCGGLRQR